VANVNLGLTYLTVAAYLLRCLNTTQNSKEPSAVNRIIGPNMSSQCLAYRGISSFAPPNSEIELNCFETLFNSLSKTSITWQGHWKWNYSCYLPNCIVVPCICLLAVWVKRCNENMAINESLTFE